MVVKQSLLTTVFRRIFVDSIDGAGENARFTSITGFCQLTSQTLVVVDHYSHCLRLVDRVSRKTSPFAGDCGNKTAGYLDGPALEAKFNFPHTVVVNVKDPTTLFLSDMRNNAIRKINALTRAVSTYMRDKRGRFLFPTGFYQDSYGNMQVAVRHSLCFVKAGRSVCYVGRNTPGYNDGGFYFTRFRDLFGITRTNTSILVADNDNARIRVVNINTDITSSICTGATLESSTAMRSVDGNFQTCRLNSPYSLLVVGDTLFIGEDGAIRQIKGKNTMLCYDLILLFSNSIPFEKNRIYLTFC